MTTYDVSLTVATTVTVGTEGGYDLRYSAEVMTKAVCAIIQRADGTTINVTAHVDDIIRGATTFKASPGISSTAHATSEGLSVDNRNIIGLFTNDIIDPHDLRVGLYKGAEVWLLELDYESPNGGMTELDHGFLGNVTLNRGTWVIEFRSLTALLDYEIGERFERRCPHKLGDSKCGVDLTSYTFTGSVTAVTSRRTFVDTTRTEADNYFRFGELTWTSGDNSGVIMDVKTSDNTGIITLLHSMPFDITVGDGYSIVAGCNKMLKMSGDVWGSPYTGDCRAKFDNVANEDGTGFGGWCEMVGDDAILSGQK